MNEYLYSNSNRLSYEDRFDREVILAALLSIIEVLSQDADWSSSTLDEIAQELDQFGMADTCPGLPGTTCGLFKAVDRRLCPRCWNRAITIANAIKPLPLGEDDE